MWRWRRRWAAGSSEVVIDQKTAFSKINDGTIPTFELQRGSVVGDPETEWLINGQQFEANKPLISVKRDSGAVWRILRGLGFDGGQALEPGCGSGLFIAAAPNGLPLRWTGVERDPTSAQIAALLHPGARIVTAPLERVSLPPCGFDAAVGNVPFADVTPYDPTSPKLSLHNYFIWRAAQAVRPGGLVAVVTSRYTLDAEDSQARELLAEDADLVGATRLPSGAFRDFGTEVVCDLLMLRREGPFASSVLALPDFAARMASTLREYACWPSVRPWCTDRRRLPGTPVGSGLRSNS